MLVYLIIVALGLFLGLHPNKVPSKTIVKLLGGTIFCLFATVGIAYFAGFNLYDVVTLKAHGLLMASVVALYTILLALMVKALRQTFAGTTNT